jgi:hypothetical protein
MLGCFIYGEIFLRRLVGLQKHFGQTDPNGYQTQVCRFGNSHINGIFPYINERMFFPEWRAVLEDFIQYND